MLFALHDTHVHHGICTHTEDLSTCVQAALRLMAMQHTEVRFA